ncbi:MAG: hypothetical protein ABSA14_10300 [Acidimicrobiales bacterium]
MDKSHALVHDRRVEEPPAPLHGLTDSSFAPNAARYDMAFTVSVTAMMPAPRQISSR